MSPDSHLPVTLGMLESALPDAPQQFTYLVPEIQSAAAKLASGELEPAEALIRFRDFEAECTELLGHGMRHPAKVAAGQIVHAVRGIIHTLKAEMVHV